MIINGETRKGGIKMKILEDIEALKSVGMVVLGGEHIEGLISNMDVTATNEALPLLIAQSRGFGVSFHRDPSNFDEFQFILKLGELGFSGITAKQVCANLRATPAPNINRTERF